MAKSAPTPPAPVNPATLASAQGSSNIETAIAQAYLNNRNTTTPFGSTSFTQTGTQPVTVGNTTTQVPTFSSNVTLSPQIQSDVNKLLGSAGTALGEVSPTPLRMPTVPTPSGVNTATENAVYGQEASRLDPQWTQATQRFQDQMTAQGLQPGDKAYDDAYADFQRAKTDAYATAQNQAITTGAAVGGQLFGEDLQANQQDISQQELAQTFPINEVSAILQGQGALPSPGSPVISSSSVSPTDVIGAYGLAQAGAQNRYATQANLYSQNLGGLAGLGGQALLAYALA